MALVAEVSRGGIRRVVLEQHPEGVYLLAFEDESSARPVQGHRHNDLDGAKLAALEVYGVTEAMWQPSAHRHLG